MWRDRPPGRYVLRGRETRPHLQESILTANAQTLNQGLVALRIRTLQILQKTAPLRHHRPANAPGVMVLLWS